MNSAFIFRATSRCSGLSRKEIIPYKKIIFGARTCNTCLLKNNFSHLLYLCVFQLREHNYELMEEKKCDRVVEFRPDQRFFAWIEE